MAIKSGRGFTIIEMVVVLGIVVIVGSMLVPALSQAKKASKEAVTRSNLRQIYIGLAAYRENYDNKLEYGPTVEMGLPVGMASSQAYLSVLPEKSAWRSPCCCHPDGSTGFPNYEKYFIDYSDYFTDSELWTVYVRRYEGQATMVIDTHCADHAVSLYMPTEPVKLIGVRLNGSIEARSRTTSIANVDTFWNW